MHVGIIPDGNRRYMLKRGINNLEEAYRLGIERFYDLIDWSYEFDVDEITIYTLSLENLKNRSKEEIEILLNLFSENAISSMNDERLHKRKIKINICGDRNYFAKVLGQRGIEINNRFNELEEKTKDYDGMKVNLAIAYGGRQEIINAVKGMIKENIEVNEENIRKNLWIKSYPDLIIRTSEHRLSNFLLWQSAYSEIYFVNKLWEEFQKDDFIDIINDFKQREKRFGR